MCCMQIQNLDREWFLAPEVGLDGSNNNTGNVVSRKRGLTGTLEERRWAAGYIGLYMGRMMGLRRGSRW